MAFILFSLPARADLFGGDVAVLVQILAENIKHYEQFQMMISQGRNADQYLRWVNSGIENSIGLLQALPVKDERILADLYNFKSAVDKISVLYGMVPKSKLEALQTLNDQTVAESIRMANSFKDYSDQQEQNSITILRDSRQASPKGAARMQAEASGQILNSLSQLIRLNTQMLKLQSEQLAMQNKQGKDQVDSYERFNSDLSHGFQNFKLDQTLSRF